MKTVVVTICKNMNVGISDASNYLFHVFQLSPTCVNITFYPAFHHLLPPMITSLA